MKNINAFTLAEVLITLGVVGVVAAVTLPTLIKNYQKQVWVNQLKKSYSMLEQGFQKMLADEGVDSLYDVSFFSPVVNNEKVCDGSPDTTPDKSECQQVFDGLTKYFKGSYGIYGHEVKFLVSDRVKKKYVQYDTDIKDYGILNILDGQQVNFYFEKEDKISRCSVIKSRGGHMCRSLGNYIIDINGLRGPNQYGRDVFIFDISDRGKLYPRFGVESALFIDDLYNLAGAGNYWKNWSNYCGTPNSSELKNGNSGLGCAARIMEEDWKMNY